jgi:hypothetical protein
MYRLGLYILPKNKFYNLTINTMWLKKHWMSLSPEYSSWRCIFRRCTDKSVPSYKNYWWKWITISFKNFEEFYSYMWPRPWKEYTVDRINNSKWYEPWNIRWATMKEQSNNKTNNVKCVINWEEHTLQERADKLWISRHKLKRDILKWKREWTLFNYKHSWKWY